MRGDNKGSDYIQLWGGIVDGEGTRQPGCTSEYDRANLRQQLLRQCGSPGWSRRAIYLADPYRVVRTNIRGGVTINQASRSTTLNLQQTDGNFPLLNLSFFQAGPQTYTTPIQFYYNRLAWAQGGQSADIQLQHGVVGIMNIAGIAGSLGANYIGGNVQATGSASSTNFEDKTSAVNTVGKYLGWMVWDTTSGKPVYANGALATSTWVFSDGTLAYTPV